MNHSASSADHDLEEAARITVRDSLQLRSGERVLIVTNPQKDVSAIAMAIFRHCREVGARANLIFQEQKTQFDDMDPAVLGALKSRPDVYISISSNKLGKDPEGRAKPYKSDGISYDSITYFLIQGLGCTRGFWSPGISRDLFISAVPVDFARMKQDCLFLKSRLDQAEAVRITAPSGTDLRFGIAGRLAMVDDGDFSRPGTGGNLPAGEAFISPQNGTAEGVIVYDGSMTTHEGTILIRQPLTVRFEKGFITAMEGEHEAEALSRTIAQAETDALKMEQEGKLPKGRGETYRRNARHLGELGIGVNPKAGIVGNMLVDEKAAQTCHLALGANYDNDAPALIHLDGLVKNPTITLILPGARELVLVRDGEILGS